MRKEHSPSSPPSSDPLPSSVARPTNIDNLKLHQLEHLDEEKTALWDLARSSPDHSLREFFAFVIRRRGTVFEELLLSPMTWFAFAVYGFVRLAKHGILAEEGERLVESTTPPEAFTRYLTTFTVFFTVFYTSQTYQRYNWGYDRLCDAAAGLFDCMFLARHELRRARALRFSRYLSVAYAASFAGASYEYSAEALLFPWIRRYHLLTESELQRLSDLEPDTNIGAYREVLVWASWVVEDAYRKDEINDHQRNNFNKNINRTRYALSSSWDYKSRPFPFIYVHLLYVSVFLFLGFNAHVYATTFEVSEDFTRSDVYTEVYGVVCIAILCFFVVGVYKISVAMSTPFGGDLLDLPVLEFWNWAADGARMILESQEPEPMDEKLEFSMEYHRDEFPASFGNRMGKSKAELDKRVRYMNRITASTKKLRNRLHPGAGSPSRRHRLGSVHADVENRGAPLRPVLAPANATASAAAPSSSASPSAALPPIFSSHVGSGAP